MRALALLVLLAASPAFAGDVGVVVVGEATMQPQLVAQIEGWLRQHGHQVKPAPLPPDAINTLMDCFVIEDEPCARKVVEKRAKTDSVVFARVDLKSGDDVPERTVTLTAYWFEKAREPIAERRFCERCTDVTLRSTADELMAALTIGSAKDGGKLKLVSTPAGATVRLNGNAIGVTPLEIDLRTGAHRVSLSATGRHDETRDFTIRRGETTQLDVFLKGEASKNFFPAIFLGTGAAMLATGVVLFVIDEDKPEPVGQQKPFYRDTAAFGVGMMVGGLVVGGVGGYLLFRSRRESQPIAAVSSDGAYIGWAGDF